MSDHTIDVVASTASGYEREVEARKLLVHFIRDDLDLTGTHVGCDTGNCGACTVLARRRGGEELHAARRRRPTAPRSRRSRASPATAAS